MANISTYLEELILSGVFRDDAVIPLSDTHYVAIFPDTATEADLEAGTLTDEITTYAEATRPVIQFDEATPYQQAGKATLESDADVVFTVMPAETVGYLAIMDSATKSAGNVLYWAELTVHQVIAAGDKLKFIAGTIKLDLD